MVHVTSLTVLIMKELSVFSCIRAHLGTESRSVEKRGELCTPWGLYIYTHVSKRNPKRIAETSPLQLVAVLRITFSLLPDFQSVSLG